jgi:predicted O-methyltransferase YrrM
MDIKQRLKDVLPASLERSLKLRREARDLRESTTLRCDAGRLRKMSAASLRALFDDGTIHDDWLASARKIEELEIPDGTGGVNPGDRRAIYYLIRGLRPSSVLEVGTHIGASTLHIAEALERAGVPKSDRPNLVSVDVADVNDPVVRPWVEYGMKFSPVEILSRMGLKDRVEFVTGTSIEYLARCEREFDFIFLDGDHAARTVYREVPAALESLRSGGLILLHDYFPDLKPLWSDGSPIPGPFLATERLREEGANVTVLPLGELPWPTKLQSNVTSLALLLRKP